MNKFILISLLFTVGCGFDIRTNDSKQDIKVGGESYSYVVVRLEYIKEIQELCKESNLREDFTSDELHKKAIADCTLENMKLINIDPNAMEAFNKQYCEGTPDPANYSPEDYEKIIAACRVLNGDDI